MLSRSEPQEEIEIATNKITTMFLYFGIFEPQCSYKHGSYKKKSVIVIINDWMYRFNSCFFPYLNYLTNRRKKEFEL